MSESKIRLTKADLQNIESEVQLLAGNEPTLEQIQGEGYTETAWLNRVLDWIRSAGRVVTLLVAESIQSVAALVICVVFALLEYWRVYHGAQALGQVDTQASLIAFAVVTANVVHPIYALRELRGQPERVITQQTAKGYWDSFWARLFGQPHTETVSWSHNPALNLAARVITLSTIVLAVYDLVAPLLTSILTGTATKPGLILVIELLMGLGLSLAGVFFLQAASHEIGVRILTDQPLRLVDILEQRRQLHSQYVTDLREQVRERYAAGKLAEQERKANPTPPAKQPGNQNGRYEMESYVGKKQG